MRALLLALLLLVLLPVPASASAPTPSRDGVWPLDPRPAVAAGFDPPEVRWGSGHRGVDLAGRPGQAVHASLAGTVSFAGVVAGRGVVAVDHGGFGTTYEPVEALVAVGEPVLRGEVIGVLRHAGSHCAPRTCLHWGIRRGEEYLDPLVLVGAGPVRLLPLGSSPSLAPAVASSRLAPLVVVPAPWQPVVRSPARAGRVAV